MNFKTLATQCALFCALIGVSFLPLTAQAQTVTHWVNRQLHVEDHYHGHHGRRSNPQRHHVRHRSPRRGTWQTLSYVGGGVAVAGILTHDPALVGIGIVGGLYSTYRFEQDRHSNNPSARRRVAYFNQPTRRIHGHRYHRVMVMRNGHHYYGYRQG